MLGRPTTSPLFSSQHPKGVLPCPNKTIPPLALHLQWLPIAFGAKTQIFTLRINTMVVPTLSPASYQPHSLLPI